MKKIIVSLMVLAAAVSANAQEAFKHVAAGLQVGTTGAGVQVAVPVVTDHVTLKLGYNFPAVNYTVNTSMDISELTSTINNVNAEISKVGGADRINTTFNKNVDLEAPIKLDMGALKAMCEYYPSANSSFHFVLGAVIGTGDFISADLYTDASFWSSYKGLQSEVNALNAKYQELANYGYTSYTVDELKANLDGKTYAVKEKDGRGHIDASVNVLKARPYFGIGIGRSVPKHRVSAQFDLGAWYHGAPELASNSTVAYDASAKTIDFDLSKIKNVKFFPQVSAGIVVLLF
ncbi:MAG: hypothetical protein MJY94_06735 [Bacteroidales bacterium]|nr:hypothetical protein [Bacteroidales bacterium]